METKQRSRASSFLQSDGNVSDSSQYLRARVPIKEAVDSAFSTESEIGGISPEIITHLTSQITANVLKQLQSTNLPANLNPTVQDAPPEPLSEEQNPVKSRRSLDNPVPSYQVTESPSMVHSSLSSSIVQEPAQITPKDKYPSGLDPSDDSGYDAGKRPRPVQRSSTDGDLSSLEKAWGKLFDKQQQPTPRLGQFLRGIAVHLIEEYEPQNSMVVTPEKMLKYYQDMHVEKDFYPWRFVFDHRTSSISRMLRDLEVEHHLIQEPEKYYERPELPGLTPRGFEIWAKLLLRAHPDIEYQRLAITAQHMPIANPDARSERFPKELPERLFHKDADETTAKRIQGCMSAHCRVDFPRRPSAPEASNSNPQTSPRAATFEMKNAVPRNGDGPSAPPPGTETVGVDGDKLESRQEETPLLERPRRPFVAEPGGGKVYNNIEIPHMPDTRTSAPEPKLSRSLSNTGSVRPDPIRTRDIPVALHQGPTSAQMDSSEFRKQRSNTLYGPERSSRANRRSPSPRSAYDGPELRPYRSSVAPGYGTSSGPARNRSPSLNKSNSYGHPSEYEPAYNGPSGGTSADDARRLREWTETRKQLANDVFDSARMTAFDPQQRDAERGRDFRQRLQSVSGYDSNNRPHFAHEDYHPKPIPRYHTMTRDGHAVASPSSAQHPPSSYRDIR